MRSTRNASRETVVAPGACSAACRKRPTRQDMSDRRLHDRLDARNLVLPGDDLALASARDELWQRLPWERWSTHPGAGTRSAPAAHLGVRRTFREERPS